MAKRRRAEGFSLAFLDIMSCGLGAVILVFMLVKQNIDEQPVEIDNLQRDISQLERVQAESKLTLSEIRAQLEQENLTLAEKSRLLAQRKSALSSQQESMQRSQAQLEQLKSEIASIEIPKQPEIIESEPFREENTLLGLRVQGPRIAILLDMSASMTDEKLIDILRTKSSSQQVKQQAPKWQRTVKVTEWLLTRLPENSEVVVVAFSEDAQQIGPPGWQPVRAGQAVNAIRTEIGRLTPEGATNLQKGLNAVNRFSPSNIYLITDGLPTKGESEYRSLNPFSRCSSLTGNAQTISGECRVRLFQQTIRESGMSGAQVDVILLPLEGDPDAINQYWGWAASTGGLVIAPANDWP